MTEARWRKLFSLKLQELILEKGMTENSLSTASGLGQPAIWKYTHCLRTPSALSILKLAYALGVTTDELMDFGETVEEGIFDDRVLYAEVRKELDSGYRNENGHF